MNTMIILKVYGLLVGKLNTAFKSGIEAGILTASFFMFWQQHYVIKHRTEDFKVVFRAKKNKVDYLLVKTNITQIKANERHT